MLPGLHGSDESRAAFGRLQLEIATSPAAVTCPGDVTVNEVLAAYIQHAERYYVRADGKPTNEISEVLASLKPVRERYGDSPASAFGPRSLTAVRQHMIELGWCRGLINKRLDRVKRAMKWAVAEELIPAAVYDALRALPGLRRGRTDARESKPVEPVAFTLVEKTLPFLPAHVRGLVEQMMVTGMRPAEACAITLGQIDRTSTMWNCRPTYHKSAHHDMRRVIPLGPRAQAVLIEYFRGRVLDPNEPVFSPRAAREERFATMRAKRRSKVTPSQESRKKSHPELLPAARYEPHTVAHAVRVAAEKAGVEHWHPYQLRHSFTTMVRKQHGIEAAQDLLGHARADVTQVYAERNEALAVAVAAKIG